MTNIKSQIKSLYDYHWHTNQIMIDSATGLDESQLTEHPGYGHGSILDLLVHILRAENSWRLALETGQQTTSINKDDLPDLESIREGFSGEQQAWKILLAELEDTQIAGDIELTSWHGDVYNFSYWQILQHVVMHGMQHHSELAQLLTQKGRSPGDIDFIFYQFPSK